MPSSTFVLPTIISFLLTLNLCSADLPGASGPSLPNPPGYSCAFEPPSGCGPDATSPAYNDCLVRDSSVTEFIQCANETSTIGDDDDQKSLNALNVLVSAIKIPACNKCKARTTFTDYQSLKEKSVKLANYLCGKVDDSDICCLSNCIGARQPEHTIKGICKNDDINLFDNDGIDCGGDSDDGEGGGGGGDSNDDGGAAASSSATVADASKPTVTPSTSLKTATQTTLPPQSVTPSTSLSTTAQTTSPTQTATSSPAGSSSSTSSAGSSIRAANITALGLLVLILTAGIGGAV